MFPWWFCGTPTCSTAQVTGLRPMARHGHRNFSLEAFSETAGLLT